MQRNKQQRAAHTLRMHDIDSYCHALLTRRYAIHPPADSIESARRDAVLSSAHATALELSIDRSRAGAWLHYDVATGRVRHSHNDRRRYPRGWVAGRGGRIRPSTPAQRAGRYQDISDVQRDVMRCAMRDSASITRSPHRATARRGWVAGEWRTAADSETAHELGASIQRDIDRHAQRNEAFFLAKSVEMTREAQKRRKTPRKSIAGRYIQAHR